MYTIVFFRVLLYISKVN